MGRYDNVGTPLWGGGGERHVLKELGDTPSLNLTRGIKFRIEDFKNNRCRVQLGRGNAFTYDYFSVSSIQTEPRCM